jgi:DMSO reductase anchor subunit
MEKENMMIEMLAGVLVGFYCAMIYERRRVLWWRK